MDKKIGIIGIGNMGTTLIAGLLRAGGVSEDNLCASDVSAQRCYQVSKTYRIKCFSDNKMVVKNSTIVIIAVEPKHVQVVLEDINEALTNQVVVSIAAGVSTEFIKNHLQKKVPIVRVMPNNPCMVGEGMIAVSSSPEVSEETLKVIMEIFSSVGQVLLLDESVFSAVTGLSGSGPAFIYLALEGLIQGGVKSGLTEEAAMILAAQTVLGSGKMVLETKMHPVKLKEMVGTPGGTTIEGLKELEAHDIKTAFSKAVERATQRAHELKM